MGCSGSKDATQTDNGRAPSKGNKKADKKPAAAAAAAGANGDEGPKIIVVFGATGNQGKSVVRALAGNESYKVRAVTRQPDGEKAQLLVSKGIEVVGADYDDAETVKAAVNGAYGVFLVTTPYGHMDAEKEAQQGKTVVDACKEAGVKHLVVSGLPSIKDSAVGEACPPFDAKAEVEEYAKQSGVPFTSARLAFYYENLATIFKARKGDDGNFYLDLPMEDKPLNMISVWDFGECVQFVFNDPDEFSGKILNLARDKLTVPQMAEIINKYVENKTYVANPFTAAEMQESGTEMAPMAPMFKFFQLGSIDYDIELVSTRMNVFSSTFEQFIESQAEHMGKEE